MTANGTASALYGAEPALAQQGPYAGTPSALSLTDALLADAGSAMALIGRQMAIPFRGDYGLPLLVAIIGAAIVVAWPVRLWLLARLSALMNRSHRNTELATHARAVGAIVLTTTLVAVSAQIALGGVAYTLSLLPEVEVIAHSLATAIAVAGFGLGIGRALRSPDDKSRRPVQMPSGLGRAIGFYPFAAGIMLGLTGFIDQTSRVLQATTTSWTIAQGVLVIAEAVVAVRFLILAGHARERQIETAATGGETATIPAAFGMTAIAWAAVAIGVGALVLGHVRLSVLVVQELLWVALVLATAWLLTQLLDALVSRVFDTNRRAERFATSVVGVQQARVAQAALLGSAILTVVVWMFAFALVMAPLHGGGAGVAEQVKPSPMLESLRALDISPRTVLVALGVLIGGILLTRTVRGWLENRFLPSTALDVGARTSIVTGMSYLGIIVAMLCATSALGVQLEKITLVASALSVGIGFGLQSIIQNFVSGVILLIERPVKPGDWVSVSGAEGNVRKIRVRATELATADGGISIVPNSAFISSTVANHADVLMSAKLELSLTVSGCASAVDARDLLVDVVGQCDALRDDPKPRLYLRTLADEEWGFDLKVYGKPGQSVARARSDLLFWLSSEASKRAAMIKLG